jgi:hypothetical protein
MSKYGNVKVSIDGYQFDSKAEAARYTDLRTLAYAGAIEDLQVHPTYELQPAFLRGKIRIQPIRYEADFAYIENGRQVAEDVKGVETAEFKLKRKLFLFRYPDIELRVLPAGRSSRAVKPKRRIA